MSRGTPFLLIAWLPFASVLAEDGTGFEQASGVNLTADEGFGARQAGMALVFPAFQRDADAAVNAPAAMNDVEDFTFSTAHAEKFGRAQFDDFALVLPFAADASLGLGLSRFGVNDIELRPEGTDPLASQPQGLFNVADYAVTGAFARRWGGLDLGINLDILYRHLDQDGLGLRADAMAQYTWDDRFRLAALAKGLVPSSAHWESGYTEYETPDLYLGGSGRFPAPYFYGTLEVGLQTEGVFSRRGKSQRELKSGDLRSDPESFLAATRLGAEFLFDFGMAVRLGLTEIAPHSLASTATFGIGYSWRHILGIDYSFTPHPDLLSTHRISLQLTPAFPKLNGRGYRPHRAIDPNEVKPDGRDLPLEEGEIEEPSGALEPKMPAPALKAAAPSQAPSAPAPAPTPSAQPSAPPQPQPPAATSPSAPEAPVAPAKPAPPSPKPPAPAGEILENNED
jgi:hypothetical protein